MYFLKYLKFIFVLGLATIVVAGINPWNYSPLTFQIEVPEVNQYNQPSSSSSWTGDFLWGLSYVFGWMMGARDFIWNALSLFNIPYPWNWAIAQIVMFSFVLYVIYFVTGRKTE